MSTQLAKNRYSDWHMWPVHGQKWCKDNSVVPFFAIAVLFDFWGFVKKVFVSIEKPIFALYYSVLNVFRKVYIQDLYASCTVYKKWQSALLSAAGDLSRVYGCLAHSHYNRTSLAARAFRSELQLLDAARTDRGCDIAMAYPGMENFCHRPRHQSCATSV